MARAAGKLVRAPGLVQYVTARAFEVRVYRPVSGPAVVDGSQGGIVISTAVVVPDQLSRDQEVMAGRADQPIRSEERR